MAHLPMTNYTYPMTARELQLFESHNWKTVKVGRNSIGEPVYQNICESCQSTIPEARESRSLCPSESSESSSMSLTITPRT